MLDINNEIKQIRMEYIKKARSLPQLDSKIAHKYNNSFPAKELLRKVISQPELSTRLKLNLNVVIQKSFTVISKIEKICVKKKYNANIKWIVALTLLTNKRFFKPIITEAYIIELLNITNYSLKKIRKIYNEYRNIQPQLSYL